MAVLCISWTTFQALHTFISLKYEAANYGKIFFTDLPGQPQRQCRCSLRGNCVAAGADLPALIRQLDALVSLERSAAWVLLSLSLSLDPWELLEAGQANGSSNYNNKQKRSLLVRCQSRPRDAASSSLSAFPSRPVGSNLQPIRAAFGNQKPRQIVHFVVTNWVNAAKLAE